MAALRGAFPVRNPLLQTLRKGGGGALACSRCLNLHEYQSKELMRKHGVSVQQFQIATNADEAGRAAKELGVPEVVLKAQVLAGGRGKGTFSSGLQGGVKVTKDLDSIQPLAAQMIGYKLKTKQTPGEGVLVNKVMVAEALDIARETYFAIVMDRATQGPVMVGSPAGGMDIEEVAETTPEKIFKVPVDICEGVNEGDLKRLAENMKFKGAAVEQATKQMKALYQMFLGVDATQVEINPLGETPSGDVYCFDAKINFDDNAKYRQKAIFEMEDVSESDPREVTAAKHNLNYIGMDGNIGCLVNGAGLAMATMDVIKLHGGSPANFLDVGGAVKESQVLEAFKLITSDPQVKAVLVNIFGGIVDCATIATGVTKAAKQINLAIPLVVRVQGTNVEAAQRILEESGLPIGSADSLAEAATKAVNSIAS